MQTVMAQHEPPHPLKVENQEERQGKKSLGPLFHGLLVLAARGDIEWIKDMLGADSSLDVDIKDARARTALYWAVWNNQRGVYEFLLKAGALPSISLPAPRALPPPHSPLPPP